jgi:hypothetical protein
MVNEVDDKTFDVAAIMVLISHDQDRPVSQRTHVGVRLANLETYYLCQILDLLVFANLFGSRFTHVQELAFQWKDTKPVPSNDIDSRECK